MFILYVANLFVVLIVVQIENDMNEWLLESELKGWYVGDTDVYMQKMSDFWRMNSCYKYNVDDTASKWVCSCNVDDADDKWVNAEKWRHQFPCQLFAPKSTLPAFVNCSWISFNTLWPSDTIWWHRSGSTVAQVIHQAVVNLNQCWLLVGAILWHSL